MLWKAFLTGFAKRTMHKENSVQEAVRRACALFCSKNCFVRYLCAIRPKSAKTQESGFGQK